MRKNHDTLLNLDPSYSGMLIGFFSSSRRLRLVEHLCIYASVHLSFPFLRGEGLYEQRQGKQQQTAGPTERPLL